MSAVRELDLHMTRHCPGYATPAARDKISILAAMWGWNDVEGRTQAEVADMFNRLANRLRREEYVRRAMIATAIRWRRARLDRETLDELDRELDEAWAELNEPATAG
jgi:hypothetical protein